MGCPPCKDHFINAVHNREHAKVLEQQVQATSVAMGTLDESQVSGLIARTLAKLKSNGDSTDATRERSTRDLLQQALLDYIDDLNRDIANIEAGFAKQFGDAWREEIALRVFGPDEIPQQREGESIEDYRKRLEKELIAKMLNPDGTIKDEYLNDPELRKYAEWAQQRHNRAKALGFTNTLHDPTTTPAQTQEIIEQIEHATNSEINNYAADALQGHEAQKMILAADDNIKDAEGSKDYSAYADSFGQPNVQ